MKFAIIPLDDLLYLIEYFVGYCKDHPYIELDVNLDEDCVYRFDQIKIDIEDLKELVKNK
jgi:hypothetical protein